VKTAEKLKVSWTWEEWQASRAARKAVSDRFGPPVTRRRESSSDRRLRRAFKGERGPAFNTNDLPSGK
jgi:hypothetical protein